MPPSLEERLAYLEGKVEDHSRGFGEVRELLVHMDGNIRQLDRKVDGFRQELAHRIDAVDQKVDRFREELAGRMDAMAGRMDDLNRNATRHFMWLVGLQFAFMLTVIGLLLGS